MALCCTSAVLFWNKVGCLSFILYSTKLTKLWSNIKKQKEDDYHYGGERESRQVVANSLIPTVICLYITLARLHLIHIPASRLHFQESTFLCCYSFLWFAVASHSVVLLLWMQCRYLGKRGRDCLLQSISPSSPLEACSRGNKWRDKSSRFECCYPCWAVNVCPLLPHPAFFAICNS